MGIPVQWSDITGAKVIIETPLKDRIIDPSQGSHFFHNMVSARSGYFTIPLRGSSFVDFEWILSRQAYSETGPIHRYRFDDPLTVLIDGRSAEGVILKGSVRDGGTCRSRRV